MPDEEQPGLLDTLVETVARWLTALGFNGNRLAWKWQQRRRAMAESSARSEVLLRSAKGRHKMCPSCRALIERSASHCSECGESVSGVKGPGVGRLLGNLFPGVTAATSLLMLVNGFWFLMMLLAQIKAGSDDGGSLLSAFGPELTVRFGSGLSRPRMLSTGQVVGGEWWRLITPIFLHGGLIHFFFNSYLLLNLGPVVEQIYRTPRYWVIYLTCGIAGSAASQIPRFVNTVGASGAIMGLIGLLLVHGYRRGGLLGESMRSLLMRLVFYSIVLSLFFNIDHLNHLGGLVCGAALALVVPTGELRSRRASLFWEVLSVLSVLLVLYAFYLVAAQGRPAPGA